jgi:hypothetical protein
VEALWDIGDWSSPAAALKADKVFDDAGVMHYEGGNAMYLTDLSTFQKRWQGNDGLKNFQAHVHIHLNLV